MACRLWGPCGTLWGFQFGKVQKLNWSPFNRNSIGIVSEAGLVGVKKTGKGRRKIGRKKRRMRARIRHRKK